MRLLIDSDVLLDFIVTHGGEVSVSRAVRRVAPDELFSVLEAEQGIVFDVIDF